jgi:GNAT superfamily N-acetyltransferase
MAAFLTTRRVKMGEQRRRPREKVNIDRLDFRRLSPDCERGDFDCDYIVINDFFNRLSLDYHQKLKSRIVTAHLDGSAKPVGFFAMKIWHEPEYEFSADSAFLSQWLYQKSLITVNLEWLAVSTEFQRREIGTHLMGQAIDDFYEVANRTGIAALTLQPIDEQKALFYKKLGFTAYGSRTIPRMFLDSKSVIEFRMKKMLDN